MFWNNSTNFGSPSRAVFYTLNPEEPEIIVDGVTGILVEANDPIALADVLQNSINNRQYVATISVKAEIAAEEYSDAKMARLYESGLVRIHSEARR